MLVDLIEQRNHDLETLHVAAIISCNFVSPVVEPVALAAVEERLHALPVRIMTMVSFGIWVGATHALVAS